MKPVWMYLDEAAQSGLVRSDRELAQRIGVTPAAVCEWRKGRSAPNEDQAAALAEFLGKPEVLAECMAARAKNPANRAIWERAAKTLSAATASVALAVIALLLKPAPALASTVTLCIM